MPGVIVDCQSGQGRHHERGVRIGAAATTRRRQLREDLGPVELIMLSEI